MATGLENLKVYEMAEETSEKYTELLKAISGYIKFIKSELTNLETRKLRN
jgi:hypothetical protein